MASINPLSLPKGVKLECELCNKTAHVQCPSCRVSYYCTELHQDTDWDGIHSQICPLLKQLRTPPGFLGSEEERQERRAEELALRQELLQVSRREGHRLLYEGNNEMAMPSALQSLRFAIALYGPNHIELVPSYLLLGEASIGLHRFKQADEYLSLAKWAVLKSPDCSEEIRAQLARNFGLLYAAQGKYEEALAELATDAYYRTQLYGPDHVHTSGAYFQLGNVFCTTEDVASMEAMYTRVVNVWRPYLTACISDPHYAKTDPIDVAQRAEAMQMLCRIQDVWTQLYGTSSSALGLALFVRAMLHFFIGELTAAEATANDAHRVLSEQEQLDAALIDEVEQLIELIEEDALARY